MKNTELHPHTRLLALILTLLGFSVLASTTYATDKESEKASLLDEVHISNDITCADCHGNTKEREPVLMVTCLECHDTATLAEKTADYKPTNPHKNRHYSTETDCNSCHHQHKTSENFCLPCHVRFDFKVP